MRELVARFFRDEDGVETVEMVIILVVLVTLAFAFRRTLINWYNGIIDQSSINSSQPTISEPGLPTQGTSN